MKILNTMDADKRGQLLNDMQAARKARFGTHV